MLVLSRAKDESVIMGQFGGETMRVTVLEIRGDKVRLGFKAPDETQIHREEVWVAIERERAAEACSREKAVACASQSGAADGPM